MKPVKLINEIADMEAFNVSPARKRIGQVIETLAKLVTGYEIPADGYHSDCALANEVVAKLDQCSQLVDEIEPLQTPQRFGNPSYRQWLDKASKTVLTSGQEELDHYFTNSFGSSQRIDYGTGHELNFIAYWDGLLRLSPTPPSINGTAVLYVFNKYFNLCKKIIRRYNLEPAGSHGVWGLDDHFHLPYILGAAQLSQNGPDDGPQPKDVLNAKIDEEYKDTNLYFSAICFINEVKQGAFFEHSPMLYDISGVKSWTKIKGGMIKMYNGEVLCKFPVVQHFYFGELFPYK